MKTPVLLVAIFGASLVCGCGNEAARSGSPSADATVGAPVTPPSGAGHAAADVVPGSYDDWCAEHEVPETQCTRCDPSLIPAFQAANDWDAEHGLPMSQCTIHDPNLKIARPPKPEGR